MRKGLWLVSAVLIFTMVFLAGCGKGTVKTTEKNQEQQNSNSALTVKVLDIGQGDAILIRVAGQTVLVDTGDIDTRDKMVAYIKKEGITTIDKVIITHPHADHLGGMIGILENFKVRQIYDSGQTGTTALYRQYLSLVNKKNIPFTVVTAGTEIVISNDIKMKFFAPEKPYLTASELNNNSVVAKLIYNKFSMLLTGDAEKESEGRMLKTYAGELKSTVLKSGHHGSNTSSTSEFLKAVGAEAVIISLGANNDYHHPHPSTLKKYEQAKLKVYRTDQDGTVSITSDGSTYQITKEK
ncbi:ComEC/Rec2 family competence protein [Pelosinus sp. sgz500959]|uniref:ComEC/Rec2 family competence protein n=1 Tax=Pelosinus sp. sgz500959 TaxID=3242472 RepID=UPI00366BCE75